MISVRRKDTKKAKTTGNSVEGLSDNIESSQNPLAKRNRSKTLSNKKQPLPNPDAFILTEKKRIKHVGDDQFNPITPTFHNIIPNTPMKRSQSAEERTQQERYQAELLDRYTTKIAITQTKNSTIYRVTDTHNQVFVLKELNPIYLKKKPLQYSAISEYKHAKLLAYHPNIVLYDSFIQFGACISFQMEYLPAGTLEAYLKQDSLHDPITGYEKDLLWLFLFDLLNALSYMHSRKIVHMDLKTSNILMTTRPGGDNIPMLKIGDFGLSRIIGSDSKESFKKGDGKYLAPELLEPGSIITTAVDIFSLGICIYEMATDFTASDILWQNIINNHIVYDKLSHDLKPLIAQMLCKDPSLRISATNCLLINDRLQTLWRECELDPMIVQSTDSIYPSDSDLPADRFMNVDDQSESHPMIFIREPTELPEQNLSTKPPMVSIRKKLF